MPNTRYLKVAAAAEMLAVSPDKITDLIRAGLLRAVDVSLSPGGKARWRIAEPDLDAFLESRRTGPKPVVSKKRSTTFKWKYY